MFKQIELQLVNSSKFFHQIFLLNITIILVGLSVQKTFKTHYSVQPVCFATISASSTPSQQSSSTSTTSTPRTRNSFEAPNHSRFLSNSNSLERQTEREKEFFTQVVCEKPKNSILSKLTSCFHPQIKHQ